MGFILFDKSGVFDPAAHGLSAGDTIRVVVVGGGGGGTISQGQQKPGGNGGPSSFGECITALGGYGAYAQLLSLNANGLFTGTPTEYMKKGAARGSIDDFVSGSGTGGGGWYFDIPRGDGTINPWVQSQMTYNAYNTNNVFFKANSHTGGQPVLAVQCKSTQSGPVWNPFIEESDAWSLYVYQHNNNSVYLQSVPKTPVAGGCAGVNGNSYYNGTAYCKSKYYRSDTSASGGAGYGAGGGSADPSTYTPGGCSGEVKQETITLSSADPIAVSVGGGGSGAMIASNVYYAGLNGTAGAPGGVATTFGCPGGYGTMIPTPNMINGASASATVAGGGAGGCVAIWW